MNMVNMAYIGTPIITFLIASNPIPAGTASMVILKLSLSNPQVLIRITTIIIIISPIAGSIQ